MSSFGRVEVASYAVFMMMVVSMARKFKNVNAFDVSAADEKNTTNCLLELMP